MLSKILSRAECAKCKVCCVFDRSDIWEIPIITDETAEYLKQRGFDTELEQHGNAKVFHMEFKDGQELSYCPMLTSDGCKLGDNKPFDCRVWPFRVMRLEDNLLGITVSPVCETVSTLPLKTLSDLLLNDGLADKMFAYAEKYPAAVKPYEDNYPILSIRKQ